MRKAESMKFILSCAAALSLALLFPACANNARIFKNKDGSYMAQADERERDEAVDEAAEGAKEYCEKLGKRAVFLQDKTKYTGSMDENTRKVVRNASKAGVMLGGHNSPVGTAGMGGMMMTNDKDYRSEIHFN